MLIYIYSKFYKNRKKKKISVIDKKVEKTGLNSRRAKKLHNIICKTRHGCVQDLKLLDLKEN